MSFTPLSDNLSSALTGVIEPSKILDIKERNLDADVPEKIYRQKNRNIYTLIIIIMSAIIFVTIISIYDIIRNVINNYYANISLNDPNSHNNQDDIERTIIANNNELWSSIVFAIICLLSSIIFIPLLIHFLL